MDPTAHQNVQLNPGADLQGFRQAVRIMTWCDIPPEQIAWSTKAAPDLFGNQAPAAYGAQGKPITLPRHIAETIRLVVCHSDPEKYALLYRLAWRVMRKESWLLVDSNELVHRIALMEKSVKRDIHKMHAFVRFRQVDDPKGDERFVAWFEPEHFIVEATAQFFVDRFTSMHWAILTPKGSLFWDGKELRVGPPASQVDAAGPDAFEAGWRTYYESTFNPARTNLTAMRQHMPKKYWRNLPETQAIPQLVQNAASRVEEMIEMEAAMPVKRDPAKAVAAMTDVAPKSLAELNRIITATDPFVEGSDKAVLGEGPIGADIAFIGEQPGDQEDLQGKPFVGPAGKLLDRAMEEAGIERQKAYVTNAVKHFKFEQRGKRRLHKTPTVGEVKHYRWWLEKELELVHPKVVVALGATAIVGLAGKSMPVGANRGPAELGGRRGYITVHPSYLLRLPDAEAKEREYKAFVQDLKRIRDLVT